MDSLAASIGHPAQHGVTLSEEHAAFVAELGQALGASESEVLAEILAAYIPVYRHAQRMAGPKGQLFALADARPKKKERTGPQADLVAWFVRAWAFHRDGAVYEPQQADWISSSRLLRAHPDVREIQRRANNMFLQPEKWWVQNCSLRCLETKWNALERE